MILPNVVTSGVTPNSPCALEAADAEPRDHLVPDEERAVVLGEVPQRLVVAVLRHHDALVREDRFDEDGGDVVAVLLEHLVDGLLVVERDRKRVLGERLRDTGRGGARVVGVALDERRLLRAVVAALHDDYRSEERRVGKECRL